MGTSGRAAVLTRWSWRLALAAGAAFVLGPLAAHFSLVAPRVGFAVFALGGLCALVATPAGVAAFARGAGASRFALYSSLFVGGTVSTVFLVAAVRAAKFPVINDIATDPDSPPRFVAAARAPANARRDLSYPGAAFAAQQRAAYPDLRPLLLPYPPAVAFARVEAVARAVPRWTIVRADREARVLEGTATSWLFRFRDDFVIEVRARAGSSAVHMRSKSRDGRGDLGANAARIRAFLHELGRS